MSSEQCKTEHLFLVKKSDDTFWQKSTGIPEKEDWWPKRGIYHGGSFRKAYHPELKEDPITKKSKKPNHWETHCVKKFFWSEYRKIQTRRKLCICTLFTHWPKESTITEDPHGFYDLQWLLHWKKEKFSSENFGLGKPLFYATSHLEIEAK